MVAADLSWSIYLQDAEVWQRERTVLMVEVQSTDRFANLEASLPRIDGVDVQAIPASNAASANGKRILRIGWALFPHTPGTQRIDLPPVRYRLNGRDAAQWQAPPQTLRVQALPPYLPPTTPVGKVTIDSRIEPAGWLQPGHLAYWHISLHSETVTTAQFPPILRQLQTVPDVEIFPPTMEKPSQGQGTFRLDYRIPFKPQGNGRLDLPILQWHWFDPASGRLEQVQHPSPHPWVLGWLWRGVPGLVLAGILLTGAFFAGKAARQRWRQWRAKRGVLRAVQGDANPQVVRQAMQECAAVHGWPGNFSTGQWLQQWERVYGRGRECRGALHRIERLRWQREA